MSVGRYSVRGEDMKRRHILESVVNKLITARGTGSMSLV